MSGATLRLDDTVCRDHSRQMHSVNRESQDECTVKHSNTMVRFWSVSVSSNSFLHCGSFFVNGKNKGTKNTQTEYDENVSVHFCILFLTGNACISLRIHQLLFHVDLVSVVSRYPDIDNKLKH